VRRREFDAKTSRLYQRRHDNLEKISSLVRTYTITHERHLLTRIDALRMHDHALEKAVNSLAETRLRFAQEFVENTLCTLPSI
jgi:hypothetical protein